MKQFFLILLFLNSILFIYSEDLKLNRTGNIYRAGTNKQELLYTQEELISGNSNEGTVIHNYYNTNNELVAYEIVKLSEGKISNYESSIDGTDFTGYLKLEDDNFIIIRDRENQKKTKKVKFRDDLVVGPLFSYFLEENITALNKGEEVNFKLPFIEMLTLASMKFINTSNKNSSQETISIEMIPKNIILSLFIDPIQFILDAETGSVLEIHGQTILPDPLNKDSNKLIYADIYYFYEDRF